MLPIGNIRAWGEKSIKKQVGAEIVAEASGILSRLLHEAGETNVDSHVTGCDAADKSFIFDYKIAPLFRGFRPAECCVETHVSVALVAAQSSRIPRGSQV